MQLTDEIYTRKIKGGEELRSQGGKDQQVAHFQTHYHIHISMQAKRGGRKKLNVIAQRKEAISWGQQQDEHKVQTITDRRAPASRQKTGVAG